MLNRIILAVMIAWLALVPDRTHAAREERRPNLILILCDDLGYADIRVQGARHATPVVDRMAAEGIRFTSFYTAGNVCTPTRASIMTGCYPRRVGLHENETRNWVLFPGNKRGINADEITLPELLKTRGYSTAIVGKWHLGDQPQFLPTRHGFDEYFGIPYSNDMGRTEREKSNNPPLPLLRNERIIENEPDQRQLTRRLTEFAVDFIGQNRNQPFFLYFAHPMPHWPQFSSENFAGKSGNGQFGDSVTEIDWSTGQILRALKELDLDDNTLVVFMSDNGGPVSQGANNMPLRGAKGTTWEGGHRVPFVARWPGKIPAGTITTEVGISFDLYTTFARLAGAELPTDRVIDGRDITPLLMGRPDAKSPHEAFFYYHVATLAAVRSGPWKLVLEHQIAPQGRPDQKTAVKAQLYNLDSDMRESNDLIADHPDVVARLTLLAQRCRADLGDGTQAGKNVRPATEVQNATTLLPRVKPAQ